MTPELTPAATSIQFTLPAVMGLNVELNGNTVRQLLAPEIAAVGTFEELTYEGQKAYRFKPSSGEAIEVLCLTHSPANDDLPPYVLKVDAIDLSATTIGPLTTQMVWLRHLKFPHTANPDQPVADSVERIRNSWKNAFSFVAEDPEQHVVGIRPPQLGAIHAAHAHWIMTRDAGTIVMPTGTGKTETMLALLVAQRPLRLLVIVPTDELRTQMATKFLSLGLLKKLGVVSAGAELPIVGTLKHTLNTVDEVNEFFTKCNVVISTMSLLSRCSEQVQKRIAALCPYLFIDEAHHTTARTWSKFKTHFVDKHVLQFTATPYREDEELIDGKIIFNYSLRRAQKDGYFRPITFKPVREFNQKRADSAIAKAAIAQLREDSQHHKHVLMARVETIQRAREVFKLYAECKEFNPILLHTALSSGTRREARKALLSGHARIVVCVDMLGEGFDLPALKIAAFHDVKKSLPVTLQLIGRFVRNAPGIGNATAIANTGNVEVRDELRKLYVRDADWTQLVREEGDRAVDKQLQVRDFLSNFKGQPDDVNLARVELSFSTVVYRTRCVNWTPIEFHKALPKSNVREGVFHSINDRERTLIILVVNKEPIEWASAGEVFNYSWDLYALHWDKREKLLYINSSTNKGWFESFAQAVAGTKDRILGDTVFRHLSGIHRLKLYNVGLREQLSRRVRFTMRAGSDVESGITQAQMRNTSKSNVYGLGYEHGEKTSVGCSIRGRLWSYKRGNINEWIAWCRNSGRKLVDESIDPHEVLKGTLKDVIVTALPTGTPLYVEWPEEVQVLRPEAIKLRFGDVPDTYLDSVDLELKPVQRGAPLCIVLNSEGVVSEYTLLFVGEKDDGDFTFQLASGPQVWIQISGRDVTLEEFYRNYPPIIWFVDGSSLEGNRFVALPHIQIPYRKEEIIAWDWTGTDIRKEDWGETHYADAIQHRVVEELKKSGCTIIFDDNGPYEAADIIAIRLEDRRAIIELIHIKFSHGEKAGGRIEDLYELCGQAQKNIHWKEHPERLLKRIIKREDKRVMDGKSSRIVVGDMDMLLDAREAVTTLDVEFKVTIVQPGLSKAQVSGEQLELLGVTENYLMETCELPFSVIGSP